MSIIHRYLLTNFFQSLAIFFVTFAGLYIIIDAFGNLEEFIDHAPKAGGLLSLLGKYYGLRSLVIFDRTSGVLTLIAAMFTLTALERHNELTALMAAGISPGRLARPLIGAVIVMSLVAVANRELLIPAFQQQLSTGAQDFAEERGRPVKPQYDYETDVFINGRSVFVRQGRIEKPRFRLPTSLATYGAQVAGEEAIYHAANGDRPAGYLLCNVTLPEEVATKKSLSNGSGSVLLCPGDTPWLKPDQCFLLTNLPVEQVSGDGGWRKFASTFDMISALRSPSTEFGPDIRVAVHSRLVSPLLDMTLLFLGLPLVLARESRNIFLAIGMCLAIVLAFFTVVLLFQWLGNNGMMTPAAAAWAPLALFVPLAIALYEPLREQHSRR